MPVAAGGSSLVQVSALHDSHSFLERLEQVAAEGRRYCVQSSLAVLDLDRFGAIVEERGRVAGDGLLGRVGDAIRNRLRETDFAGRLGGDEFGVVMPQTPRGEAELLVADLVSSIRRLDLGGWRRLAVTVGCASTGPGGFLDSAEALDAAESAVRLGKVNGGGKVRWFEEASQLLDGALEDLAGP